MNIEKDICKVLSKKEIELMNNDMAHVLVMKFHVNPFMTVKRLSKA